VVYFQQSLGIQNVLGFSEKEGVTPGVIPNYAKFFNKVGTS
jgi:hypothetical protein